MSWFRQLDKHRGSRPRCVLLVDGSCEEVADRLTQMVGLPDVAVSPVDKWMPYGKPLQGEDGEWDTEPANEAQLGNPKRPNSLVQPEVHRRLTDWWLAVQRGRMTTPNWDIASTCTIRGKSGLLLVEAKAHSNELASDGKSIDPKATQNSVKNHERIGLAIAEAATEFKRVTGRRWDISRDDHYQLSNRFAWSWKLVSLGIPVVLVYLGFLNAKEMCNEGPWFESEAEWERVLKDHGQGVVDETCWGKWLDFDRVPFAALVRAKEQPFDPSEM